MTSDEVRFVVVVEGDQYAINEWENQIQEIAGEDLEVDVRNAEVMPSDSE